MGEAERPLRLLSLGTVSPKKCKRDRISSSSWLDGGGIRGLSSLYILKQIMVTAQSKEADRAPPGSARPCEYFDLIAGTSTGGYVTLSIIFS